KIVKSFLYPIRSLPLLKLLTHMELKVATHISLLSSDLKSLTRDFISRAALFVNVIANIFLGATPFSLIKYAIRCVNTRVFPLPAPAIINSGPSVCLTAACCSLFNPFNNSSIVLLNQSHHLNLIFLLLLSLFLMHLLSLYKYYYRQ